MVQSLNSKTHRSDAYILEVEGRFLVRPSPAIPKNKNTFRLSNLTTFEAIVTPGTGLALQPNEPVPLPIPGQTYGEWNLEDQPERSCRYTVELVLGAGVRVKAHGDSDPVIIIDPAP